MLSVHLINTEMTTDVGNLRTNPNDKKYSEDQSSSEQGGGSSLS